VQAAVRLNSQVRDVDNIQDATVAGSSSKQVIRSLETCKKGQKDQAGTPSDIKLSLPAVSRRRRGGRSAGCRLLARYRVKQKVNPRCLLNNVVDGIYKFTRKPAMKSVA
jgi:hypothetical protein